MHLRHGIVALDEWHKCVYLQFTFSMGWYVFFHFSTLKAVFSVEIETIYMFYNALVLPVVLWYFSLPFYQYKQRLLQY